MCVYAYVPVYICIYKTCTRTSTVGVTCTQISTCSCTRTCTFACPRARTLTYAYTCTFSVHVFLILSKHTHACVHILGFEIFYCHMFSDVYSHRIHVAVWQVHGPCRGVPCHNMAVYVYSILQYCLEPLEMDEAPGGLVSPCSKSRKAARPTVRCLDSPAR